MLNDHLALILQAGDMVTFATLVRIHFKILEFRGLHSRFLPPSYFVTKIVIFKCFFEI